MMMSRPNPAPAASSAGSDLYALPLAGRYLLYSPLRRLSALINKPALEELQACLFQAGGEREADQALRELWQELEVGPPPAPQCRKGTADPAFLGIIPTRSCNMSCVYCDFHSSAAQGKVMDIGLATAAVDWMADWMQGLGRGCLEVHFFGGEPFFAPQVVEVAVHRARSRAAALGLATHFEATSNGVYSEATARFIEDYFDTIVLSLDGPADIQNRQRPLGRERDSFALVSRTAARLADSPVELCLRACVSKYGLGRMPETAAWFCESFSPAVLNFETLIPTPQSRAAGLEPPNPYDFARYCLTALKTAQSYGVEAVYASADTRGPRNTFCPVGQDTLIVSPGSRVSGCYLLQQDWLDKGLDLDLGYLETGGEMLLEQASLDRLRRLVLDKPRCRNCFCRHTCAGGCHVSNTYPGSSLEYNDFCVQTRLITACLLLEELGAGNLGEEILNDGRIMEVLALNPSDRLEDYRP